jgi:GTP-binding protein
MRPSGGGKTRIILHAPTRGLIGYHPEFMTDTRGTGVMNRVFHEFAPSRGDVPRRQNGVLISTQQGKFPHRRSGCEPAESQGPDQYPGFRQG